LLVFFASLGVALVAQLVTYLGTRLALLRRAP